VITAFKKPNGLDKIQYKIKSCRTKGNAASLQNDRMTDILKLWLMATLFKGCYIHSFSQPKVMAKHMKKRKKKKFERKLTAYEKLQIESVKIKFIPKTKKPCKQKYAEYLESKKWKGIKKRVLKRDGNKCVRCKSSKRLQVHHKTYGHLFNERINELITLCSYCHKKEHHIGDLGYGI